MLGRIGTIGERSEGFVLPREKTEVAQPSRFSPSDPDTRGRENTVHTSSNIRKPESVNDGVGVRQLIAPQLQGRGHFFDVELGKLEAGKEAERGT